jgi:hypothetical protein
MSEWSAHERTRARNKANGDGYIHAFRAQMVLKQGQRYGCMTSSRGRLADWLRVARCQPAWRQSRGYGSGPSHWRSAPDVSLPEKDVTAQAVRQDRKPSVTLRYWF